MKIFISHSACPPGEEPKEWFVVKANPLGLEDEIESLISARRTVVAIDVEPRQSKLIDLSTAGN